MKKFGTIILSFGLLLWPSLTLAHCPLCTVGAGLLAVGASFLGVSMTSVGLFLGAFGVATGMWVGRALPKRVPQQINILGILSWLLTIIPLTKLSDKYVSFYLNLTGSYGSWLNRTYALNEFLFGSLIGGIIVFVTPILSRYLTKIRQHKQWPFQGIALTFVLLIIISLITEFIR